MSPPPTADEETLDEEHLARFMRFLGHERFCIKSVQTGVRGAQEKHFDLINANKAVDYIKLRNGKRQLWVNVQKLKKNSKQYHAFDDIEAYTNIFIDIDANKPDDKKDYAATKKERGFALAQLPTVQVWLDGRGFKPGLAFKSGNGAGLLLPVPPTPPTPEFIAKVATFLKVVRREANVDVDTTTFDPPRVCGILQTWNTKTEDEDEGRKNHLREAIGDVPARDEDEALLKYIERLDPDPEALRTWTEKFNAPPTEDEDEGDGDDEEHLPQDQVDVGFVRERLNTLLETDPKLQNLLDWTDEEKERHKNNRSDAEFGLVGKLTAAGFTDPQINWVMTHISRIGKWAEEGEHYQEVTLKNIRAKDAKEVAETGTEGARQVSEEELASRKMDNGPKFELNLPGNHYLTRYIAYGRDVSDAYPDYWLAGGLYQLAVIADKKIWIKLRQGPVYPNLYIFIAGRSSLSRKSTVVDVSEALLNDHRPGTAINAVPTEFSPEAFIEHLDESPHAPWVRDEAAGVLSTMRRDYMRGFKDSLMQLYDCRSIHRKLRTNQRKKSKTEFIVDDPYLNVLWATTDSSLAANTEINDTLSGFMARFIYHFPRRPKERWLPLEEGEAMNSELELVVRGQLTAMSKNVSEMVRQQLNFSKEASEYWTQWQKQRAREIEKRDDANEMQIHSRLVPLVAKLSMLFELGSSDFDPAWRRPIRLEYVVEACRLVDEYYQPMAMAVYDMVGRDLERNIIDRIIAFLKRHGGVSTKREISRHVKIKAKELDEYLATMTGDGTIEYCYIKNPRGEATIKVVLNVSTVYTVDNVDTVNTVTRNTEDMEEKRVTESEDQPFSCGDHVTVEEPKLGDRNDPRDSSDSSDSSDSMPALQTPEPKTATAIENTEPPRIFGLSIPYYLDLGGGHPPTVKALMQDQSWPQDKAVMAIGMLEQHGYSREV